MGERACVSCETSRSLCIKNLGMKYPEELKPLLQSLSHQQITKFLLPGNRLRDEGVECLCKVLDHVQAHRSDVEELDLTVNEISCKSIDRIATCTSFHSLTRLVLAHNSFSTNTPFLNLFKSCPQITHLNLSSCDLNPEFFRHQGGVFQSLTKLQYLDLSNNDIGLTGLINVVSSLTLQPGSSLHLGRCCKHKLHSDVTKGGLNRTFFTALMAFYDTRCNGLHSHCDVSYNRLHLGDLTVDGDKHCETLKRVKTFDVTGNFLPLEDCLTMNSMIKKLYGVCNIVYKLWYILKYKSFGFLFISPWISIWSHFEFIYLLLTNFKTCIIWQANKSENRKYS